MTVRRRRSSRKPVEQNPVPPAPHVGGRHHDEWVRRTFPVGTPVMFTEEWTDGITGWTVAAGTKAEVVDVWDDPDWESVGVTVELFPSYQIPKGVRLDLRRQTLYAGSKHPVDYHSVEILKPLVDTWGTPAGPAGRHHLPRSQRSWMRPNQGERVQRISPPGSAEVLASHFRRVMPTGAGVQWWAAPTNADIVFITIIGEPYLRVDVNTGTVTYRGADDLLDQVRRGRFNEAQRETIEKAIPAIDAALRSFGDSVEPNPKARSIGSRPSMDTKFGQTIEDPDTIGGAPGKHLDKAMARYETFHAKSPIRIAELEHDIPKEWVEVGDALAVMYRTDKWKRDGNDEDYKHLHDRGENKPYDLGRGVRLFEPVAEVKRSRVGSQRANTSGLKRRKLPITEPKAITLLGYCLGFFVRRDDDGEIYECNPRGCYLFCSPSGDMLIVYSPDKQPDGSSGVLAIMAGGNLRVLKDGIDG